MVDWWEENGPPAYVGVASYLGLIKPKKKTGKAPNTPGKENNLEELANRFRATGGMIM